MNRKGTETESIPPEGDTSYRYCTMTDHRTEDKAKPFRLVKYFALSSFSVIFVGTIVLSLLNSHWTRALQEKKSEEFAVLLVENLNHQIFLQFIIPVALKFGKIQLREQEQFDRMEKIVRSTLHSFNVESVNIYDKNNTISYSFEVDLIGKKDAGGKGYLDALEGKTTSKRLQRGNFWEILLGFPKDTRLVTFAPLRAEKPLSRISGPVLGVVEIVQDLSDEYRLIYRFQIMVILTITVIMGLLFLVLLALVKRGEGIIEQRTMERMKLKEQLSRAKHLSSIGEMVAGVSHEIRNPLGIIRSSAELLKKKMTAVDPSSGAIPDIIVQEANRLNNIITDFLAFARPKNPERNPCRIEEIIERNISFLSAQLDEQGYTIKKRHSKYLPEINADASMLYQAFLNLFINAMQAMPDGGTVSIEILSNDHTVTIFFEDEGLGIPEDLMEQIWNPFFTTKEKGTGLGLGIVKNIIEGHGGSIQIHNRPVSGARVTVKLPVRQED